MKNSKRKITVALFVLVISLLFMGCPVNITEDIVSVDAHIINSTSSDLYYTARLTESFGGGYINSSYGVIEAGQMATMTFQWVQKSTDGSLDLQSSVSNTFSFSVYNSVLGTDGSTKIQGETELISDTGEVPPGSYDVTITSTDGTATGTYYTFEERI